MEKKWKMKGKMASLVSKVYTKAQFDTYAFLAWQFSTWTTKINLMVFANVANGIQISVSHAKCSLGDIQ